MKRHIKLLDLRIINKFARCFHETVIAEFYGVTVGYVRDVCNRRHWRLVVAERNRVTKSQHTTFGDEQWRHPLFT